MSSGIKNNMGSAVQEWKTHWRNVWGDSVNVTGRLHPGKVRPREGRRMRNPARGGVGFGQLHKWTILHLWRWLTSLYRKASTSVLTSWRRSQGTQWSRRTLYARAPCGVSASCFTPCKQVHCAVHETSISRRTLYERTLLCTSRRSTTLYVDTPRTVQADVLADAPGT